MRVGRRNAFVINIRIMSLKQKNDNDLHAKLSKLFKREIDKNTKLFSNTIIEK